MYEEVGAEWRLLLVAQQLREAEPGLPDCRALSAVPAVAQGK